jgi:hypothetical protein
LGICFINRKLQRLYRRAVCLAVASLQPRHQTSEKHLISGFAVWT